MNKQKTTKKYLNYQTNHHNSKHNPNRAQYSSINITAARTNINTISPHQSSFRNHIRIEQDHPTLSIKTPDSKTYPNNKFVSISEPQTQHSSESKSHQLFRNNGYYEKLKKIHQNNCNKYSETKFIPPSPTSSMRNKSIQTFNSRQKIKEESGSVKWNNSVNTKDVQQIKDLNNKNTDLKNENNRLKLQNQQLLTKYKQIFKLCQQIKKANEELMLGIKSPLKNRNSFQEQFEHLLEKEEKLKEQKNQERRKMEEKIRQMSIQIQQYKRISQFFKKQNTDLHEKNRQLREKSMIGLKKPSSSQYDNISHSLYAMQAKFDDQLYKIAQKLSLMEIKQQKNDQSIQKFQRIKNIKISNTFKHSHYLQNIHKPSLGDLEDPQQHLDESGLRMEEDLKYSTSQKNEISNLMSCIKTHNVDFGTNTDHMNDESRVMEQIKILQKQNVKLKQQMKKEKQKYATVSGPRQKKIMESLKNIRDQLQNCNLDNFDLFIDEFSSAFYEKKHLYCELKQLYEFEERKNTKAWKLQKQLNEKQSKYRELVNKYVRLQNYIIEKNQQFIQKGSQMDQQSYSQQNLFEEIYNSRVRQEKEGQKFNVCNCQVNLEDLENQNGYMGQNAIKWTRHVKNVMDQAIEELSYIIQEENK